MKNVLQNVLWLLLFLIYHPCQAKESATIGVFVSEEKNQSEVVLNSTLYIKNTVDQFVYFNSSIKRISDLDSFGASKVLCKVLEQGEGVAAIIGVDLPTSSILESICAHFDVPYLLTSLSTPLAKADGTVLNFFPKANLFAKALAQVVKSLQWKNFVIIYENEEGLIRLQEVLKLQSLNQDKHNILVRRLGPGSDHRALLKQVKNAAENNIILDCKTENIIPILKQANELNLLKINNNYFLTSLDAHTLDYTELKTLANITTIRLFDPNSENFTTIKNYYNQPSMVHTIKTETVIFYDALFLLTNSINELSLTHNIKSNPINCSEKDAKSSIGYTISAYMKQRNLPSTLSGPLSFDEYGNRNDFTLQVVDILKNQLIAKWFEENTTLVLSRSQQEVEKEYDESLQRLLVNVASRLGEPYLMLRKPKNGEVLIGNDRFEGYSIDLIHEIAKILNFKYQFILTKDGQYGRYDDKQKKWTGLIGDILEGRAQLAVADLTITHQRRSVVDFSIPFMTTGISILHRKEDKRETNIFAFLDPFGMSVWIYTATLYLIISVVLYFISRMTPGDWVNPHPCDENPKELKNIWDLKSCMWLTLSSIMIQGCDILPKGISSRMAISMWWFFSLIIASFYTANLAILLIKDRAEPTIDSVTALSNQNKIKYGTLEGGSTQAFFRDSNFPVYQKMWANMISSRDNVFVDNHREGVKKVQTSRGKYAFLMESTHIEYEIETKCDLRQVGDLLDMKSYGIAMPINSGYRTSINKAILKLHESGILSRLKEKWWKHKRTGDTCAQYNDEESNDVELTLANLGGLFSVLGVGIAIAVILAIWEFLWNVRTVSMKKHMTYWEALKAEFKFACKVWITKKRIKPIVLEFSYKADNKDAVHSVLLDPL